MNANDIRIGNRLLYNGKEIEITGLRKRNGKYSVLYRHEKDGSWITPVDSISSIPLTEEWLVKFGFIKDGLTFRNGKYILWFNGTNEGEYSFMIYDERDGIQDGTINDLHVFSIKLTTVSFVHRLQNLWFELENEELTTKQ